MSNDRLLEGVVTVRPFVPSKDFQVSQRFYADLGFEVTPLGDGVANVQIGDHAFLLQNYYVEEWAGNFMMHMLVTNLDEWWSMISSLDLPSRFDVRAPSEPQMQPWGLKVAYVVDPAGVLWHFAEAPKAESRE
jgi:hypothetical protein